MPRSNVAQKEIAAQLQPEGGLAQMMAQQGASKSMVKDVQKIEDTPGGKELLYTFAAEEMMKKQGVPKEDTKKIRLYKYGGAVERAYAKGGDVKAAAATARGAGRGEDEMLVHMTEEEFGVIKGMWGEPDINPNTGLPEYGFLSKLWKGVKKVVKKVVKSKIFQVLAPIALSIFVPGLGTAIGGMLGAGTGTAASVVGNALVRGGLSAAGGRGFASGAISGAISGGLGSIAGEQVSKLAPGLSDRTAAIVGSSLASGAGSSLMGGDFVSGAVAGGLGEYMRPGVESLTKKGQELFGRETVEGQIMAGKVGEAADGSVLGQPELGLDEMGPTTDMLPPGHPASTQVGAPGPGGASAAARVTPTGKPFGQTPAPKTDLLMKYGLPALLGASALHSGSGYEEGEAPELPPGFTESLPVYSMNRQFQGMDPASYYTYGQVGAPQSAQHLFLQPEPFAGEEGTPLVDPEADFSGAGGGGRGGRGGGRRYQRGGALDQWAQNVDVPSAIPTVAAQGRYVKGPGTGRSDDIPARLSDGEYVIDAESVALLGDGSGSAGAKRLDEMRQNLRKHKATNLKKGGFSHKAKQPHQYMARGGMAKLRRAMTASGRV
jgi:hypothetical protein